MQRDGMCPNQQAAGMQGHFEGTSICVTNMFLQCSGRFQGNCNDFLKGSKLSFALKHFCVIVSLY